jgi:hypothetical protein
MRAEWVVDMPVRPADTTAAQHLRHEAAIVAAHAADSAAAADSMAAVVAAASTVEAAAAMPVAAVTANKTGTSAT